MMAELNLLSLLGRRVKWKYDWLWHAVWDSFQMTTPSCLLFMSSKVFAGGRGNEYWIIVFFFFLFLWAGCLGVKSVARVSPDSTQGPVIFPGLHKLRVVTPLIQQSGWEGRENVGLISSLAVFFCVFWIMIFNHTFNHSSLWIENTLILIFNHMRAVATLRTVDWGRKSQTLKFYLSIILYFKYTDKVNIRIRFLSFVSFVEAAFLLSAELQRDLNVASLVRIYSPSLPGTIMSRQVPENSKLGLLSSALKCK